MKQWDFKYFNSNFGKYPGRHPDLIFFMENTWQPADSFGIRQTIAVISNNYISKYFNSHFGQLSERLYKGQLFIKDTYPGSLQYPLYTGYIQCRCRIQGRIQDCFSGLSIFSSPCQRQCELLSSLGVRRPSSVVR
jgi:hypothetical protein